MKILTIDRNQTLKVRASALEWDRVVPTPGSGRGEIKSVYDPGYPEAGEAGSVHFEGSIEFIEGGRFVAVPHQASRRLHCKTFLRFEDL